MSKIDKNQEVNKEITLVLYLPVYKSVNSLILLEIYVKKSI